MRFSHDDNSGYVEWGAGAAWTGAAGFGAEDSAPLCKPSRAGFGG